MKLKISTLLIGGFSLIILLIIGLAVINYQLNNSRLQKTTELRDVQGPLSLMVEQVISYDAMLTGAADFALLHALGGNFEMVSEHRGYYDEIGVKLDPLLKFDARVLLEKSTLSQEQKDVVNTYLNQLDTVNLELVDLETQSFDAMEQNDTATAYAILTGDEYHLYKQELAEVYANWTIVEYDVTLSLRNEIINETNTLNMYNTVIPIFVVIFAIIISLFLSILISRSLNNLKNNVEDITKGNLDVQLNKSSITEIDDLKNSLNRILATMKLAILRTGLSKSELGLGEAIRAKENVDKKYKLLYETSSEAIMIFEPPHWNFTAGNPATLKMFNLKDEEMLLSFNPMQLSPEKQPDGQLSSVKARKMFEKAMKEGSASFEWTHKRYHGENFPAKVNLNRIEEGDKIYVQGTVRDITSEKQLQKIETEKMNVREVNVTAREVKAASREKIVSQREAKA